MTNWILIIVMVLVIIFIVYTFIHMYNRLVSLRNRVENSFAQIDVQLKRRNDLIPNLVETVKGYASHEKEVLEEVTRARGNVMNASGVKETSDANNQLTGALKTLFAVAEKLNISFDYLLSENVVLDETQQTVKAFEQLIDGKSVEAQKAVIDIVRTALKYMD